MRFKPLLITFLFTACAAMPFPGLGGGGQAKKLKSLPRGVRLGDNHDAILGGLRLWNAPATLVTGSAHIARLSKRGRG